MIKNVTVKNGNFEGHGSVRPKRQALARVTEDIATREYNMTEPRWYIRPNQAENSSFGGQKRERIPIEKVRSLVSFNTILSVIDS